MGRLEAAQLLVEAGARVNSKHKFSGSTALHFAAELGHTAVVELLCAHGGNPELATVAGSRPIHVASDMNQPAAVLTLLRDCKADAAAMLLGDTTPLYLAAQRGYLDVVNAILEHQRALASQLPTAEQDGARMDFAMPTIPQSSSLTIFADSGPQSLENFGFKAGNGATGAIISIYQLLLPSTKFL